jgi:hypothetical protein
MDGRAAWLLAGWLGEERGRGGGAARLGVKGVEGEAGLRIILGWMLTSGAGIERNALFVREYVIRFPLM